MHSIIIPAYNEELRIIKTLEDYMRGFPKFEFIVVCDGTDRTYQIVKNMKKRNIKILRSKKRLGKGGAVYKGFDIAKGNTIGFTDADEGIKPLDYRKLLSYLEHYDCAVASRRAKGAKILRNRPWHIIIASYVFNKIVNTLFDLGVKDTQCGAKVMRKEVYEKIKKDLMLKGFEFDVDLLWRIKKSGFSIKEVPIAWMYKEQTKFGIKYYYRMFYNLSRLRLSR